MSKQRPVARFVKNGEMLAIRRNHLHQGPQGFFWMMGSGLKASERLGDVAIVYVRGELDHHEDPYGCQESYENILKKMQAALSGQDCVDRHKLEHLKANYGDEAGYEPIEAVPPKTVIVCIDSPGGVVAGLNETVFAIQKLRKANPNVSVVAYCNEMAASAAYALACACEEIICPRSAVIGSIGVISTMISQARKNERDGYDVRLLTSGARKADGHPHTPITDAAEAAEMGRVQKLALSFWKLASKARGLPVSTIKSYEAGIFLGMDAKSRGLVDAVMSFDDVLLGAGETTPEDPIVKAGGNQTDRRVNTEKVSITPQSTEAAMPIALAALIKKTEAAVAKEKDPKKLSALLASLEAYKKTEKHIEHTKSEEGDDGDDDSDDDKDKDEDDESEDSEESSSEDEKKMSKKAEFPPKKDGEEDDEDEEDDEEESEEKSAKAALAAVQAITGMKGKKALGALQAIAATAANTAADVAALKKASAGRDKAALIASAKGKHLTPKEATWLGTQKMSVVQGFVEMRKKAGVIVNTDDSTLIKPKYSQPGTEESLPSETIKLIDDAVSASGAHDPKAFRAALVEAHLKAHTERLRSASNGVGRI